ncbi:MAG: HD domain-containing protein [Alphaproteobacteria bacterium]|nr:HD domain-containing protein [Alphaproteobacteria bacterium]
MKNIVDFFVIAEKLECEYRLTRMSDGMPQSVASHSWNMAMMAMVLKPYLKNPVNMERVYELCLLHDLPEAIAHDVPLHKQTDIVRAQKHVNECAAIGQIVDLLKSDEIRTRFDEYDIRESYESKLVKALDVLDTAVQHMCAKDLSYIGEYADNFYWKMFFSNDFAKIFDFEPAVRGVFDVIKQRVAERLKCELDIDVGDFVK